MRKYIIVLFSLCLVPTCNMAQILNSLKDVVKPTQPSLVKSLNGEWDFLFINDAKWDNHKTFFESGYDAHSWDKIPVPGCWDALGYVDPMYGNPSDMNGLYRKHFTVPESWKGKHVFLSFEGVLRGYEVWVNGKYVDKWESSYNTCNFDITNYLKKGENLLAVRVYIHYKGFDFDGNDDWGQVGINRNVSMFAVPDIHLKDMLIRTEEVSTHNARINITFDIGSFTNNLVGNTYIKGDIKDPYGKIVARFKEPLSNTSGQIQKEIILHEPLLWDAETPNLYRLEYSLYAPGLTQTLSSRFGIREVTIDKDVIKLNGKKIKLRGVNLHETDPFFGKVVSEETNLKDLVMMKEANVNLVRCSHYPRDTRFYELCDSIGMYVMDEVPFGYGDSNLYDKSFQDILLTRADATVRRDKNHPSILFWSIGNENPLTDIAKETGRYVKRLDPTRPICYPMIHNYFLSLDFQIPDFVDIFAPHYPPVSTLRYYAEAAKRPVILTEYCHSLGQSLEQLKELWELIEKNDNLAGGCVWEWVDQGMVDRHAVYPGKYGKTNNLWLKDTTSITVNGNQGADGMLYANRIPLSNFYELRKVYAQVPVLTEKLPGQKGLNHFEIEVANRFDFIDLSKKIYFEWNLLDGKQMMKQGKAVIQCSPTTSAHLVLDIELNDNPEHKLYCLEINVKTIEGYFIGNYSIPIVSSNGNFMDTLFKMADAAPVAMDDAKLLNQLSGHFQKYPLMRVGRKFSMSEEIRATGKAIDKYLVEPVGTVTYTALTNTGTKINYSLVPNVQKKLLLEGGIAFLLNPDYKHIQWMGYGPYSSYPGKQSANNYGLHSISTGNLYFEGNRMGIDVLLCTNDAGNGFIIIAPQSNMNFEQTDKGIVLSVNSVVSGLCGKLRDTAYPVYTDDLDKIEGSLVVYPLNAGKWPEKVSYLFKLSQEIIHCENPFLSQYDTYLLRYSDIVE